MIKHKINDKKVNFKKWWRTTWKRLPHIGTDICCVCGVTLERNNPQQVKLYCSRYCRSKRHNKKKGSR